VPAQVVSAISDEVTGSAAEGRDTQRRAALCLALGCVHRAMGGLALQVRWGCQFLFSLILVRTNGTLV